MSDGEDPTVPCVNNPPSQQTRRVHLPEETALSTPKPDDKSPFQLKFSN